MNGFLVTPLRLSFMQADKRHVVAHAERARKLALTPLDDCKSVVFPDEQKAKDGVKDDIEAMLRCGILEDCSSLALEDFYLDVSTQEIVNGRVQLNGGKGVSTHKLGKKEELKKEESPAKVG